MQHRRVAVILAVLMAVLVAPLTLLPATRAAAAPPASGPGSLDASFGGTGIVALGGSAVEALDSSVVQPDGSIVAAFVNNTNTALSVVRLTSSGVVDPTWAGGSPYSWTAGTAADSPKGALGQDPQGRTYVASAVPSAAGPLIAVLRLRPDGTPDPAWGTAGVVTANLGRNPNDHATALMVDPFSGRVYVGVWQGPNGNTDFGVLALAPDGTPDPTFGPSGRQTTDFHSGDDTVRDVALAPNGDLVAVGYVKAVGGGNDNVGLWRLHPDGTSDAGFGASTTGVNDGTAEYAVAGAANDGARSVAITGSGRLFVGLRDESGETGVHGGVAAYFANGEPDTGFGRADAASGPGVVRTDFGVPGDNAGLALDSRDRPVVVGSAGAPSVSRLVSARYAFDTTFDSDGLETLSCSIGGGGAQAVSVQSNGRIVVAGTCPDGNGAPLATIWRLDGSDQVPLPGTPAGGGDGVSTAALTASAISVGLPGGAGGRIVTVSPGQSLALSFNWSFAAASSPGCPFCIDQVVAGFVNRGPEVCDNAFQPEANGGSGSASGNLIAPSVPGRYFLAVRKVQFYACVPGTNVSGLTWSQAGQPWGGAAPGPDAYLAEVIVSGVTGVSVTADAVTVPAGQSVVPVSGISLDALSGSVDQLQSAPLRASPLRASPLRASPLRASPLRASPLRASPLRASPLRASPLRASPIPLSQLPLDAPNTWASVLAGTIYADKPLQDVTLQQLLALDPVPAALANLSLADVDVSRTPLRNVSLVAFLLGNTPAGNLGLPLPTGVDASQSLIGLELGGLDLSSIYAQGVQLKGKTLIDAPISNVRLGDMWLSQTPFGAVSLSSVPATWYSCTVTAGNTCETLADVQRGDVETGLRNVATVDALLASAAGPTVTLGSLLPGLVPRDELGYERVPTDTIAAAAPLPSSGETYRAAFVVNCAAVGRVGVAFDLPDRFRLLPGSGRISVAGDSVPGVETTLANGVATVAAPLGCSGVLDAVATVEAEPTNHLGTTTLTAAVTYQAGVAGPVTTTTSAVPAVVDVVDRTGVTPVPTDAALVESSTLFLGHISSPGDVDTYMLARPASGTKLTVKLSHVTPGHDDDISVFGPATPDLRSSPLRASPLRASPLRASAVEDTTLDPATGTNAAPPEPQPDVPLQVAQGEAVIGISARRGNSDESVTYQVPEGAGTGDIRIVVSGYNDSVDTTQAYSLLVSATPSGDKAPTCANKSFPAQTAGNSGTAGPSVIAPVASDRETLILTDQKRLGDLYGASAATSVLAKLTTLGARSDVKGVVVAVENGPGVQAAYDAWDAKPCSVALANAVVARINAYVDTLRAGTSGLKNIVLAGGDLVVPMARMQDRMATDNESAQANDEVFNGQDNALSASLRAGYVLTDDPYGDFDPISWLDGQAFVPDVALGRLVETPSDITKAVDAFISSNGMRTPNAAYTAGYDFNADGAQEVADTLSPLVPAGTARATISGIWTRTDAIAGLAAAAHGFASVNAHYDAYRALPADQDSGGTSNQLLTTTDLPSDLSGGVLFTIGCHAGLSVADTFVAAPGEAGRQADWAQQVSSRGAVYAANTGYGYGDTVAIAYSERLMADFAKNLNSRMTVGQALMFAKHGYLHLPLSVVDAKVMAQATFYGLPMYKLGAAGVSAGSVVPTTAAVSSTTESGTLVSADLTSATGKHFVRRDTTRGSYYVVQDGSATPEAPLAIPARPLEPQTSVAYQPRAGLQAHGVVIDELTTHLTAAGGGFDPVYSSAAPDSSTLSPEPSTVGSFFPAALVGVVQQAVPPTPTDTGGIRDVVTLTPGQFRASGPTSSLGWQQLADHVGYRLVYSGSNDVSPPAITTVVAGVSAGTVTFTVTTPDLDAASATALFLVRTSTSALAWQRVVLAPSTDGKTFSGGASVGAATVIEQYFVQVVDTSNNVSVSSKKGQDFSAATVPAADAPVIQLNGVQAGGTYTGPQQVTIVAAGPATFTKDGSAPTPYVDPFTVAGTGAHTVVATSTGGSTTLIFTVAATPPPTVSITSPSATTSYSEGQAIPATFACTGYQVTSCIPSPTTVDNTFGTHTFTVAARDASGGTGTASTTYTVRRSPFKGFLQPIDDGPGQTMSVFKQGSTVPVKFQLVDSAGVPIPDTRAAALAAACDARLTWTRVGSAISPVDEAVVTAAADTGGCFKYDAAADQFSYNLGTKPLVALSTYALRVHFTSGWTSDHVANIGVR